VRAGIVSHRHELTKERIRQLHQTAVRHARAAARHTHECYETQLLQRIADGSEVVPSEIRPKLTLVERGSHDERLFRYASLHWSIPVSSGYGRRIRFLVEDESNGKLIGLIGLADPVISLSARDEWIGWTAHQRELRLQHIMDAFVLGAVPPYNELLCGKLVALLTASAEVVEAVRQRYAGTITRIRNRVIDGRLALITTSSALGKSSVYNRLKIRGTPVFESLGFTRGSGEFHFANGLYAHIKTFAERYCQPTYRKASWGEGFRNRREVLKKALPELGISRELIYHGVPREVFAVRLASNGREFLRGEHKRISYDLQSVDQLFSFFRDRWLLPKAARTDEYRSWNREHWRLWPENTSKRQAASEY
jgi:hypothetical protein